MMDSKGLRLALMTRTSAAVVGVLLMVGVASAGVEEDYAAGMVAYNRGDFVSAMPGLRKAADAGHAESQAVLASILEVAESKEEAVAYYRKSAAAGNINGTYGLATMLASGEGVKKDVREARRLFNKAAESGHQLAIGVMAQAYIRGELELTEQERAGPEALKWINRAADNGFMVALEALEKAYRNGELGLAVDVAKADQIRQRIVTLKGIKEKKGRRK